jgi:hypothetical protein
MAFDRTVGQTDVPQRPTPDARRSAPEARPSTPTVTGHATVYRLFDIGDEIHLDRVLERLSLGPPDRARPVSSEAQALQIPNPPVTCSLGSATLKILGQDTVVELSARVFDFGVVSLRARVDAHRVLTWPEFTRFGRAVDAADEVTELLEDQAVMLVERMGNTIERPRIAQVREDYVVYHVTTASVSDKDRPLREVVRDTDLVPLLLGESRPLSEEARRELLPHRFSYYADDLAILSWDNALIVDPSGADSDVEYILEFANAQLLELRYYDALLDAELPKLYDRIARARVRRRRIFGAGYAQLLGEMQTLVAEVTELVERAENALKVTDDVYLARIYSTALDLYRAKTWRAGIDRKLTIIRDTYAMMNGEAQARRAEVLELAIIFLIVFEIVLSLTRGG